MTRATADALFDAALLRRAPQFVVDPETAAHRPFLAELFAACSPLAGLLPPALMEMQFTTRMPASPTTIRKRCAVSSAGTAIR